MHLEFMHSRNITIISSDSNKDSPANIRTLDALITALNTEEQSKYNQLIRSVKFPINYFDKQSSWCAKYYTRNCLAENDKFELILLCWNAKQITPIHDHGGEECWVVVIDGKFRETLYAEDPSGKLTAIKTIISKCNDITYMIDFMGFHRLENLSNKRSLTLHLYAKPIRSCNVFDEVTKKFVNKNMVYSTAPLAKKF